MFSHEVLAFPHTFPNQNPICCKSRTVPFYLKEKVKQAFNDQIKGGIQAFLIVILKQATAYFSLFVICHVQWRSLFQLIGSY